MSEHTELPWVWDGKPWDYDREEEAPWIVNATTGDPAIRGEIDCTEANAAFIVKAVNNHYQLLEVLKDMATVAEQEGWDKALSGRQLIYDFAIAAIKQAEEEQ